MRKIFFILNFLLMGCFSLQAAKSDAIFSKQQEEAKLIVNNRILIKINDKAISTHDVMKKMDMTFYRYYPEYASSIAARYQYYLANWQYELEELINKELILADAKENKIEISNGEVRKEMEFLFGPNIIANLDKMGMSFDEAFKIVHGDLIIRRALGGRVDIKVIRLVTPSKVRQAYADFAKNPENVRLANWCYQVISIRDRTAQKAEETANKAYLLLEEGIPIDQLITTMQERKLWGRKTKMTISQEIQNNEKELSDSYRQVLSTLDTGMYGRPFAYKSRSDHSTIYRIFYIKEKTSRGLPSFREMENKLKEKLLNETLERETNLYLKRLRKHFHVQDNDLNAMIPKEYKPFILK